MVRILQIVNIMDRAGLETMLMNYYRNIDHSLVQFDFLTHRKNRGAYEDEIEKLGGHVYHAPRLIPGNYKKYYRYMKKFFINHPEYNIVHSHIDSMSYFPLKAAKRNNIPIRIGHSHSSKLDRDIKFPIKYFALKRIPRMANYYFACGEKAGNFMYPHNEFTIIHNAVDLEKFSYSLTVREKKRKELEIIDKFVVGHVGRFCYIKNQLFLLDIFEKIKKKNKNSVLVLVGKGEDETKIRKKIEEKGLQDSVIILMDRSDVDELYQTFDVFVMPSLFEGLPVVGVEAQANGIPCFFSDKISKEIMLTSNARRISLEAGADEWTKAVMETNIQRNDNAVCELRLKGYDIRNEAKKLQTLYLKMGKREKIV